MAWLLLFVASACADAPSDADRTWVDFDFDERFEYMSVTVFPVMREIFLAHDPERYASFACESCHGPDPAASDYAMPAFLPALPLDGTLEAAEARDPEMTQFMLDEVFGEITDLLGYEKFNHDTAPDGFRCVGCHLVEGT